jgi:flagellar basal body rod protein FlgG
MMESAPLSALGALATRMAASAANTANAQTPGYQARRVDMVEKTGGGVAAVVSRDTTPGPVQTEPLGLPQGGADVVLSNVDPAREITSQVSTLRLYQANARSLQIMEDTKGALLDIIG